MTAALLTPETLAHIRTQAKVKSASAIAIDLGWTPHRVIETARRFGIEVTGDATESVLPSVAHKLGAAAVPWAKVRPGRRKTGTLKHYEFTPAMTPDDIGRALPLRQRQTFEAIRDLDRDCFIKGRAISALIGCDHSAIGNYVAQINLKLRNTRWIIENIAGKGYRLVIQSGRVD